MQSNVGDAVAHRMRRLGAEMARFGPEAVKRASLDIKNPIEQQLIRAVGPDMRMSGVGARGAKLSVRFDLKGIRNPTSLIRAVGPWQLIERPTSAHPIFVRAAAARGRGARRVNTQNRLDQAFGGRGAYRHGTLAFPGVGGTVFRRVVQHPGTSGKRPFAKGLQIGAPRARRTLQRSTHDAAVRGFRG